MSFSTENVNPQKVDVVSVLFYAEFPETATASGNSRHLRNMLNEQMSDQVVTVAELSRLFIPQDFEKKMWIEKNRFLSTEILTPI